MTKSEIRNPKTILAGLASLTLLCGCGGDEAKWKNSPGTRGLINLDAVKEAFQKNPEVEEFEKRTNEIFEGDNLVVLQSEKQGEGFHLEASEDLDKNKTFSAQDDLLFTLTVESGTATLQGAGVNKFYKESWPYQPTPPPVQTATSSHRGMYFYHWYGRGSIWGGRYYTPASRYDSIYSHRNSYRSGGGFTQQVRSNSLYENKSAAAHGSNFKNNVSDKGMSSQRRSYVQKTVTASAFGTSLAKSKSASGWGVRSNQGIKSKATASKSSIKSTRSSSMGRSGGFRSSSGFGV